MSRVILGVLLLEWDTCSENPDVERSAKDDSEDSSFSLFYAEPIVPCGKKNFAIGFVAFQMK